MNASWLKLREKLNNKINSLENENLLLKKVIGILSILYSSKNFEDALNNVLENCLEIINARKGSILLLDEKRQSLKIRASKGLIDKTIKNTEISVGESISGKIIQKKSHFIYRINPRLNTELILNKRSKDRNYSFISLPIINKEKILGVINISDPIDKEEFNENDFNLIVSLSNQAGVIIENFELYNRFNQITYETILAFVHAIEAMDPYTEGHCQRVTLYSYSIAREYGSLTEDDLVILQYGAMLHDIGKIGIEKEILHKPDKLSSEEYEVIKKHPELGANIISPITYFNDVKFCILYHHSWYNENGGYPIKKILSKKAKILANIIGVADVYDAMSSSRPYRSKIGYSEIKKSLIHGKGSQFDPKAVDILIYQVENEKIYKADFLNQKYPLIIKK